MSTIDPVRHFGTDNNVVSATLAASRGEVPLVQPTEPDAATWLEENMREGDNYLLAPLP